MAVLGRGECRAGSSWHGSPGGTAYRFASRGLVWQTHRPLEQRAPYTPIPQLLYGILMLILATPAAFIPAAFLHGIARSVRATCRRSGYTFLGSILYALIEGGSLKPLFALRMLVDAGRLVRCSLEQQNLPAARAALFHLVSRDRSQLSENLAAAAAIESLAENVSDAVVAPLYYYMFLS